MNEAVQLKIALRNNSNNDFLAQGVRTDPEGITSGPDKRWTVTLVEITENGVVLDVPRAFCAPGENVTLSIQSKGLGDEVVMDILAQVTRQSFENSKNGRDSVRLEFMRYDGSEWERLCSRFRRKQDDVERFFAKLRG